MSKEQLKAFLAKVAEDPALQEQLKAADAEPLVLAQEAGFSVEAEDFEAALENLSDEELAGVSGGNAWNLGIFLDASWIS